LVRAEKLDEICLPLSKGARATLRAMADGDGRYLLNMTEEVLSLPVEPILDTKALIELVQKSVPLYDKMQDQHYNLISALHKSLRGSDVDASLYWLARMLSGGEDPRYIARRLVRFASEDIGLADPNALLQAIASWDAFERIGSPEGELAIVQSVIYLATAPKSNAVYRAFKASVQLAKETGSLSPPKHILNASTNLMKDIGHGAGYQYDHDSDDGFSGQNYFPDGVRQQSLYRPDGKGFENEIVKRLDHWRKIRKEKGS
jgi:putative ATPase